MKKFFLFALVAIAMCACSESTMMNEPDNPVLSRSNDQTPTVSYSVTPDMVCKYLNIARKGKTIDSITPVIEDGDTLAYVVQYTENKGWDLISGDKRVAPVLASASSGILNLNDTTNPAVKALNGMVQIVLDAKESADTTKHQVWKAFEPKNIIANYTPQSRGGDTGLWVVEDTIYEVEEYEVPHLITTKWGQSAPWYSYTPYINQEHTVVGCLAVAVGQYIYHYRKNNNRGITLPCTISFSNTSNALPAFSNFSASGWNGMAKKSSESGTDIVAKYLSYIGYQLDLDYGLDATGGTSYYIPYVMNHYKIGRTETATYNLFNVIESLDNNDPVLVCAFSDYVGHAFIIDGYKKEVERSFVRYRWDVEYTPTEEERRTLEGWRFNENFYGTVDGKGDIVEKDLYVNGGTSLTMNWGWNGIYDDTYYTSSTYILFGDDDLLYTEHQYSPSWSAGGQTYYNIGYMAYNQYELAD